MEENRKYKIVDLFAGVGGLSYGFAKDPAFEIVAANELLANMAKAYEINHPSVKVYCSDIAEFGIGELRRDFGIKKGDIDIIVGGPPCQAYSTIGKRLLDDPRGKLFQQYARVLKELDPKMFVFENVKGLLSMDSGRLLKAIIEEFESLGYKTKYKVLNAADYGAAQLRERVIIIGSKEEGYEFPEPSRGRGLKPYATMAEALGDLPIGADSKKYASPPKGEYQEAMRKGAPAEISDHAAAKNSESLMKIMMALPEGGTPKDLPEGIRPKSGFGNSYSRLWWDKPSTTITRNLGTPSSARCIHPLAPRALTTREGARLQGFPDSYAFYGSRSEKNLQIGNAVSPFLSMALKDSVKKFLAKEKETAK